MNVTGLEGYHVITVFDKYRTFEVRSLIVVCCGRHSHPSHHIDQWLYAKTYPFQV